MKKTIIISILGLLFLINLLALGRDDEFRLKYDKTYSSKKYSITSQEDFDTIKKYYVLYIAGTIVAIFILFILNTNLNNESQKVGTKLSRQQRSFLSHKMKGEKTRLAFRIKRKHLYVISDNFEENNIPYYYLFDKSKKLLLDHENEQTINIEVIEEFYQKALRKIEDMIQDKVYDIKKSDIDFL